MKNKFLHLMLILTFICIFTAISCESEKQKEEYSITIETCVNGMIEVSKTKAEVDEVITITVTPASKYELAYVLINGVRIDGLSFKMPKENVSIYASFKKITYEINVEETENGSIFIDKSTASEGEIINVKATANAEYELDYITVDGKKIEEISFEMPANSVSVSAVFKVKKYNVILSENENGTVVLDKEIASKSEIVTLTVIPNLEYELDYIKVNDEKIEGTTFEMPNKDVTVTVIFKKIVYSITVLNSENGTVFVELENASKGDIVTLIANPDLKYELVTLKVNGNEIDGLSFEMPGENAVIEATFARIKYSVVVDDIQNGTLSVDKTSAIEGEIVTITATPTEGYIFLADKLTVNGQVITGNMFLMPESDVVISGLFVKAEQFTSSALEVSIGDTTARWYATYDTSGIFITVKVRDSYVSYGGSNFGYDDNVEFTFGLKSNVDGLDTNYTYNFLATAGGKFWFRKANSINSYGPLSDLALNIAPGSNFWYSVEELYYTDGSSGYIVNAYFGYDLLNTTPDEAIGNITIAASLRDTTENATYWSCASTFDRNGEYFATAKHFALITEDGKIVSR